MIVFPAIDLIAGQAVRLQQGDFARQTGYGDPLSIARAYKEAGASHLHVVDLEAARTGQSSPQTQTIVRALIAETGLLVQLGGGIRTAQQVQDWLTLGVWRCVLGTAVIQNHVFARDMAQHWGEQVAVGIDARDGYVATNGWLETERMQAVDVACAMKTAGFTDCIYTDISKDGMLGGANVQASVSLAERSGLHVVVSGGVRDLADIDTVLAYRQRGLSGVIAGKALLEGTLDLASAIERVSAQEASDLEVER